MANDLIGGRKKQVSRGGALFAVVTFAVIILIIVANSSSSSGPSAPANPKAALTSYIATLVADTHACENAIENSQAALEIVLKSGSSVTQADYVQAGTIGQEAQALCDEAQNSDLSTIEGTVGPPSGFASLGSIQVDLTSWSSDEGQTLKDFTQLMDANGSSTGDTVTLISDSHTSDQDAAQLQSDLAGACAEVGIPGDDHVTWSRWGLQAG